jgi:centromere/kinetochore protein ZW10
MPYTSSLAKYAIGLGMPQLAERIEKRMVAREDRENIITTGTAVTQDWDAAWESDGETVEDHSEGSGRNRSSLEEERQVNQVFGKPKFRFTSQAHQCPSSSRIFKLSSI